MGNIIQSIQDRFRGLTSEQKRALILIGTGVFVVILIISVVVSAAGSGSKKNSGDAQAMTISTPIPAEELFLPDEPDYVPRVLLEREQRSGWTTEDASIHWQDPLGSNEQKWRERIENVIDDYLERVP